MPENLLSPSSWRAMLVLAVPVLIEESLNLLVGYTDWFLAGRFLQGREPLAAMGLMAYFLWVLPSFFTIVSIGALSVVARLIGAGERREAAHIARQALLVGTGVAVIGMGLAMGFAPQFVGLMQLEGPAAELAVRYMRIIMPAIPFVMAEQVGTACLRGAGDTMTGLWARVVVNFVNVVVATTLVAGLGPFPRLGWDGLAIGTASGHVIGGSIILWTLLRGGGGLRLFEIRTTNRGHWLRQWKWDVAAVQRILRVGVPGGIDVWSVLVCHLIYVAIINRLGTVAQAAHGLGVQIEALSYLPGSAFQVAAATLAGQSLGAANQRQAVRGVLLCVVSACSIMSLAGLILFFRGESIAQVFIGQCNETAILTGQLLKIVAISCPFLAILMVILGALRGSGDTAWPLAITFIGLVGVRIPGACFLAWDEIRLPLLDIVLPAAGLGVAGAWYAMVADVILRSLLATGRFLQGGWQKVRV